MEGPQTVVRCYTSLRQNTLTACLRSVLCCCFWKVRVYSKQSSTHSNTVYTVASQQRVLYNVEAWSNDTTNLFASLFESKKESSEETC